MLYAALAVGVAAAMLGISWLLGERHAERFTGEPYESGVVPGGPAQQRFDVRYYRVAIAFVVFDLETAFIMAWAVSLRRTGWSGFAAMALFIAVLLAALAYLWRRGALDWNRPGARRREE